ncbi:MAG: hypothetical protein QOG71_3720 [Pyrinomonadaceae bacterium]|nr:hypothetical protein [Pyrinomonadaceae bacterium]
MWQTFLITLTLVFWSNPGFMSLAGALQAAANSQQSGDLVVPLEGLDPVMLTRGKEVQGDEQFAVKRGVFRYLFAGAETKAAFEREPRRYEIQLGGTCARMGPTVQGNPDLFAVHEGLIYIFGSPACQTAFKSSPANYLEPAAAMTTTTAAASEESRRRGRALIERAVEASGGAARVDGLLSYEERGTVGARTPQGVTEIKTALLMRYPDKIRMERTLSFGTIATVVTPEGGFVLLPRGSSELSEVQRAAYLKQLQISPLAILRARREAGFSAVTSGAGKVGETAVEQVEVSGGGVSATLGIAPDTGRVLSLTYRGRGDGGMYGRIVRTFSDFRAVGGLTLPFKAAGTFNGAIEPSQTSTVESIVVNGDLSPSLFERPKPAGGQ